MTYGTTAPRHYQDHGEERSHFQDQRRRPASTSVLATIVLLASGVDRGNKGVAAKVAETVSVDEKPHTAAGGWTLEDPDFLGLSLSETTKTESTRCLYTTYQTIRDDLHEDGGICRRQKIRSDSLQRGSWLRSLTSRRPRTVWTIQIT